MQSRNRLTRLSLAISCAVICAINSPVQAGPYPDHVIDDLRHDIPVLEVLNLTYTTAVSLVGMQFNPLLNVPVPVRLDGRVLAHPKIHNLYLDDDWDGHKLAQSPTKRQIEAFTEQFVASPYLSLASDYEVGSGSYTGSTNKHGYCAVFEPIGSTPELLQMIMWLTCMVSASPESAIPAPVFPAPLPLAGVFPPASGAPYPDDDTLYVVHIPDSNTFASHEISCDGNSSFHFFGVVPQTVVIPIALPPFFAAFNVTRSFPFVLQPMRCHVKKKGTNDDKAASEVFDSMTSVVTHEIIEAAVDPIFPAGFIQALPSDGIHVLGSGVTGVLANLEAEAKVAEVSDGCKLGFPDPVYGKVPGTPMEPTDVSLSANDPSFIFPDVKEHNYIRAQRFWSNSKNSCIPREATITITAGQPKYIGDIVYVNSATPIQINTTPADVTGSVREFHCRWYNQLETIPPSVAPPYQSMGGTQAVIHLQGKDGTWFIDCRAIGSDGVIAELQTAFFLDNTSPRIDIYNPWNLGSFRHDCLLRLGFNAFDPEPGSGVNSALTKASINGLTSIDSQPIQFGTLLDLLIKFPIGAYTFSVEARDHLENLSEKSVKFFVIATANGVKVEVSRFYALGLIKNKGIETSLLAKLDSAARARADSNCGTANNIYDALLLEITAQSRAGGITKDPRTQLDPASILSTDIGYLMQHCPDTAVDGCPR